MRKRFIFKKINRNTRVLANLRASQSGFKIRVAELQRSGSVAAAILEATATRSAPLHPN